MTLRMLFATRRPAASAGGEGGIEDGPEGPPSAARVEVAGGVLGGAGDAGDALDGRAAGGNSPVQAGWDDGAAGGAEAGEPHELGQEAAVAGAEAVEAG
jgi:hypothetical protein